MAGKKNSRAPRIDPIRLDALTEGDPALLAANENVFGERFDAADLSGRDLSGASFTECEFLDLLAHEADLRGTSFADTRFERVNAPVFAAPRSRFRDVSLDASRLGSAEFFDASWESVHVTGCKLGYVNLRGARLNDVQFTDCTIDELDLGDATATRVAFPGTRIGTLDVTRSILSEVDLRALEASHIVTLEGLRGAIMTPYQITELATVLAQQFGIVVED
ncbi:pentapeptide repeat-containing protein [Herbiconiux sp. YIM B11900]|uniref:pentapeptide repeat-containing protein n=1 Tax=Herbiconiux sp. YIM B11900 TaxID=3404131 RepID=UPI003F85BD3D